MKNVEDINCPYCHSSRSDVWANENGYTAVKCADCGFVYVNPRPSAGLIAEAVETGIHTTLGGHNVIGRRSERKVGKFRELLTTTHADIWKRGESISWLDIGSGFGEIVEAVGSLAPKGSHIVGVEPMTPKADNAQARGLQTINGYLSDVAEKFQFASLINVFSHIPDFRVFLAEVKSHLEEEGEFLIVTGNAGDVKARHVPSALDLPDHLTFAGTAHVVGFLKEAGFEVVSIRETPRDTPYAFMKEVAKKILGRNNNIVAPYTSPYRELTVRARLIAT